jgi:hypothetical protein
MNERRDNCWKFNKNIKQLSSKDFNVLDKSTYKEWIKIDTLSNKDRSNSCVCTNTAPHVLYIYYNKRTRSIIFVGSSCEKKIKMNEICSSIYTMNYNNIYNNPAVYIDILNLEDYSKVCMDRMIIAINQQIDNNNSFEKLSKLLKLLNIIYEGSRKQCFNNLLIKVNIQIVRINQLRQERERQERDRQEQLRQEREREEQLRQEREREEQLRQEREREEQVRQEQDRQRELKRQHFYNAPEYCKKFCNCENLTEYISLKRQCADHTLQCIICNKKKISKAIKRLSSSKKNNLIRINKSNYE